MHLLAMPRVYVFLSEQHCQGVNDRVASWVTLESIACRRKAAALADQLQGVYLRDKKASDTVKAAILESLGLLLEALPEVITLRSASTTGIHIFRIDCLHV